MGNWSKTAISPLTTTANTGFTQLLIFDYGKWLFTKKVYLGREKLSSLLRQLADCVKRYAKPEKIVEQEFVLIVKYVMLHNNNDYKIKFKILIMKKSICAALILFFITFSIPCLADTGCWKKISISNSHALAIKNDGTLWSWGNNNDGELGLGNNYNTNVPTQVGTLNTWKDVEANNLRSFAIQENGPPMARTCSPCFHFRYSIINL